MISRSSALVARPVLAAAAVLLLGTVVAGCGSSGGSTVTPAPNPSSPSASHGSGPRHQHTSSPPTPHATEFNPPGDIPDNAVFVDHTAPGSRVHFTVPEGWARSTDRGVTTFTDKYNSISVEVRSLKRPPTPASARRVDVPQLRRTVSKFRAGPVTEVTRKHGRAVHIAYLMDSAPNPVTGKVVRDAVERFEFWHRGQEAILSLAGPQNADNVDPWQIVSDSLHWQ